VLKVESQTGINTSKKHQKAMIKMMVPSNIFVLTFFNCHS